MSPDPFKLMYQTGLFLWESQQAASKVHSEIISRQIIPHLSQHMISLNSPATFAWSHDLCHTRPQQPAALLSISSTRSWSSTIQEDLKIKLLINTLFSNMFPPDFSLQLSDYPRISSSTLAKGTNAVQGKMLVFLPWRYPNRNSCSASFNSNSVQSALLSRTLSAVSWLRQAQPPCRCWLLRHPIQCCPKSVY